MQRSEAGTSVYLRWVKVPPDVFLPHQKHSLSKVLQSISSQSPSFSFFVLSISLRHSLQLSCANCLNNFYKTRSFIFGSRLSQNVFLFDLLHRIYCIHCFCSPLIDPSTTTFTFTDFCNGWTRLWRSWCNFQACPHASSTLSTWLHWHGRQLYLRDGSGKRRSFRRTRGHTQRGMRLPVVVNEPCLHLSRLVLQSSTAPLPTSSILTTSSHTSSTLA